MQAKMDVDYLGHASTILKVSEKFWKQSTIETFQLEKFAFKQSPYR